MGPRHEDRGKIGLFIASFYCNTMLQWVHGTKTVVKTGWALGSAIRPWLLQWVHGTKTVVKGLNLGQPAWSHRASMGPRHEDRGKDAGF